MSYDFLYHNAFDTNEDNCKSIARKYYQDFVLFYIVVFHHKSNTNFSVIKNNFFYLQT